MKAHLPLIITALSLCACHGDPPIVMPPSQQKTNITEHLINANRTVAHSEETSIDEYVARRNWDMTTLADGARIWEYVKGDGKKIDYEDSVAVTYSVEAINGMTLYDEIHEEYVAGRRRDLVGLDHAVTLLHHGSRAKIILPSNIAYGIGGDGDRIPQNAILVIDLKVE